MAAALFPARFITPRQVREERISLLRLQDASGHFAIQRGHAALLTALETGLGYYRDGEGRQTFLAVDGGVLSVRDGAVTLSSREIFTGAGPEEIASRMEQVFRRRAASEQVFLQMLGNLEKSFLKKSLELVRGR